MFVLITGSTTTVHPWRQSIALSSSSMNQDILIMMQRMSRYSMNSVNRSGMNIWSRLVNDGIETIMFVRDIVYGTNWTIGFHQRVLTLYHVAITFFSLWFNVSGMMIINAIVEMVFGISLEVEQVYNFLVVCKGSWSVTMGVLPLVPHGHVQQREHERVSAGHDHSDPIQLE